MSDGYSDPRLRIVGDEFASEPYFHVVLVSECRFFSCELSPND